jgi:hypothetical protein
VKFIGSTIGRCVKLFAWEEVRPLHGVNAAILTAAVAERFNFQTGPMPPIALDKVLKFSDGATVIDKAAIAINKFDVYSDGFAIECSNTDDAKLVSDELFKWAQAELGYRDFIREPKITFLSQVTVEFTPGFEKLFRQWKKLQGVINASVQKRYGFDQNVDLHRLQWRGDPHTLLNSTLVSDFWIERKASEPHANNRWHCSGPLPTDEWIALLEVIENLAVSD